MHVLWTMPGNFAWHQNNVTGEEHASCNAPRLLEVVDYALWHV